MSSPSYAAKLDLAVPPRKGARFDSIQCLRGIAAALVVLFHAHGGVLLKYPDHYSYLNSFYALREFGVVGVDIFFVISGFIMVHTNRSSFGKPGASVDFIMRRLIRIMPMYWLLTAFLICVLAFVPSAYATLKLQWPHAIESLLFLPTQNSAGEYFPVLSAGWTLTYEMYFYLLFAALLTLPMRVSLMSTTALFFVSAISRQFFYIDGPTGYVLQNDILLEFVAGEWIAYWFLTGRQMREGVAWTLLAIAIAIFAVTIFGPITGSRFPDRGVPAAALLLAVVQLEQMGKLTCPDWLTEFGNESYSLYLTHSIVLGAFFKLIDALHIADYVSVDLFIPVSLLLAIVVAKPCYFLIEAPMTAWLTAHWRQFRSRSRGSVLG